MPACRFLIAAFLVGAIPPDQFHHRPLLLMAGTPGQAQRAPQRWHIAERPSLSIGSRDAEGPELFGAVTGAVRLSSGVVVVADGKNLELRSFTATGSHLKTSGGKGGGPGEFLNMAPPGVQRCSGDSLFVYDVGVRRVSVFSPEGGYVRSSDVLKWSSNGYPPYDLTCGPSGVFAFVHRGFDPPKAEGPLRYTVDIALVGPGNSRVGLGKFPSTEMYFRAPQAGPRQLGKRTSVAVGTSVAYVGTSDAFEVAEFSLKGERVATIREARRPIPITAQQVDRYIADYVVRYDRENTKGYRKYLREFVYPDVYPAYGRLLADALDNLWVEEYPIPGQALHDWTVFAKSGAKIAVVSLPSGLRLLQAGGDYVLGVWRDEDDVEFVRVYALRK